MSNLAIEGLGLIAGTLTTISFLPQVIHIWNSRSAKGLSLQWITIFGTGVFLWLIYGLIGNAPSVFIANGITLGLVTNILYFKIKFG
jgi:MtN3 and saliva related transmembrane protein